MTITNARRRTLSERTRLLIVAAAITVATTPAWASGAVAYGAGAVASSATFGLANGGTAVSDTIRVSGATPTMPGSPAVAPSPAAPVVSNVPGSPAAGYGHPFVTAAATNAAGDGYQGPDAKWGDPLSLDVADDDNVHLHFRYYSDVAGTGNQQGVGLSISFSN
jgi:hypothetical protein